MGDLWCEACGGEEHPATLPPDEATQASSSPQERKGELLNKSHLLSAPFQLLPLQWLGESISDHLRGGDILQAQCLRLHSITTV